MRLGALRGPHDGAEGGKEFPTGRGLSPRGLFAAVFALALGLRLTALLELVGSPFTSVLVGDAAFFDRWARALAGGGGLEEDVLFQSPLYPLFVGAVYRIAGPEPLAVRLVQLVLGALACGLLALATRRAFGSVAGLAAGILAAASPVWIWFDVSLLKTSLALFLGVALVHLAFRPDDGRARVHGGAPRDAGSEGPGGLRTALAAGAAVGLLALVRPNALVLVPLAALWVARARRGLLAGAFLAAAALGPLALGLRNLAVGGEFLPFAGNAGVNFYQGNGADADGLYRPLVAGRGHPEFEAADARELARAALGDEPTAAEVNSYWFRRGWAEATADPLRWGGLLARKLASVWNGREAMDAVAIEAFLSESLVLRATFPWLGFGALVPLAALGVFATRARWRELWLLHAALVALTVSIALFLVVGRLRAGLLPFLLPFAGAGVAALVERRRASFDLRALLAVGLAAGVAWWPLEPLASESPRAVTWSNLASAALRQGRGELALEWCREALVQEPELAQGHYNLAEALDAVGRPAEAARAMERALALAPGLGRSGWHQLGVFRGRAGEYGGAIAAFERSLAVAPGRARTHYGLGLALRRAGRPAQAEEAYRRAIDLDPELVDAHYNLALLAELDARYGDALAGYRSALAVGPDFVSALLRLAWILALHPTLGDPDEALRLARRARDLVGGDDCAVADVLAAAQIAAGRRDEALATLDAADATARVSLAERRRSYAEGAPLPGLDGGGRLPFFCER